MLKTSEGLASMIVEFIKQEFKRNLLTKAAAVVAMPVLERFKRRVDHRRYNGAALLGLRGLVFKSHGGADALAFEHALSRAYDAAHNRLLERVRDQIQQTMQVMPADGQSSDSPEAVAAVISSVAA
jgi:glycerol-3-phosphate acyltransferase PlsX